MYAAASTPLPRDPDSAAAPTLNSAPTPSATTVPPPVPTALHHTDPTLAAALFAAWSGDPAVVVASPPGAGKTRLVVHLAEQLNSVLLTVEGTKHTAALSGDDCVDDIVTAYLVDLKLPPKGAKC